MGNQGFNTNDKVTVLITLKAPPLTKFFNQIKTNVIQSSSNPDLKRHYQQQYQSKVQALQFQQDNLLKKLSINQIDFTEKRRMHLLVNILVVEINLKDLPKLNQLEGIKSIHTEEKIHLNLADSVPAIGANDVWSLVDKDNIAVRGKGIRVAIIDTGIDYMHPDLGGGFGPDFKVIGGWDFANNDNDPMDDVFHGTHVAGIVAANGEVEGVAPEASLLAYKVFTSSGDAVDTDIIAAMELALDPDGDPFTDDAADVINMSLGGDGGPDSPLSVAANQAMQAGIVVVVSAGNSAGFFNLGTPASALDVVTVAATDNSAELASFSSSGPVTGINVVKPEISAPGVNIRSTLLNGSYGKLDGTSMSSPHVAGAAALLIQLYPELSSAEIKDLLITNADPQLGNLYGSGVGFLNVSAASRKQIIISPALINLGEVGSESQLWTKNATFSIKNIATIERNFQITEPTELPLGVTLNILSNKNISLLAGETKTIDYQLEVDNDKLAISPNWPSNYQLNLNISEVNNSWQLPIIFHKSHLLSVSSTTALDFSIFFSNDGSWGGQYPVDNLEILLPVKAGTYTVFSLASTDIQIQNSNARQLFISEMIDLQTNDLFAIDLSTVEAEFIYGISSYTNTDGEIVTIEEPNILDADVTFHIEHILSGSKFSFSGMNNLALNRSNNETRISSDGFVGLQTNEIIEIITFNDNWLLQPQNHSIELNMNQLESASFLLTTFPNELASISIRRWLNEDLFLPNFFFHDITENRFNAQNFNQIKIFGKADDDFESSGFFNSGLELSIKTQSNNFNFNSQAFSFTSQGLTKFEFDILDLDKWETVPTLTIEESTVSRSGLFWASSIQILFQGSDALLSVIKPRAEGKNGSILPAAPIQDSSFNGYPQNMPFRLICDGTLFIEGDLEVLFDSSLNSFNVESSRDCDKLNFNLTYTNWLAGIEYQSMVETEINNTRGETVSAIEKVSFIQAEQATNSITAADSKIVVKLAKSNINSITDFSLELKIGGLDWSELIVTQTEDTYTANLETPTKLPENASVRIHLENNLGNSLTNTINSAFLYGTTDPNQLDSDDDGTVDALDAFPNDPLESVDTDSDGIGNNADTDDDGDGMPDSFEISFNLDPLDPNDAQLDPDNDGLSNLEEFRANRNPNIAEKTKSGGSLGWMLLLLILAQFKFRNLIRT